VKIATDKRIANLGEMVNFFAMGMLIPWQTPLLSCLFEMECVVGQQAVLVYALVA
tara:strand:+ start:1607 stop:1771 length:165 start_codon:yes stop_codon:yes gene_type:complete